MTNCWSGEQRGLACSAPDAVSLAYGCQHRLLIRFSPAKVYQKAQENCHANGLLTCAQSEVLTYVPWTLVPSSFLIAATTGYSASVLSELADLPEPIQVGRFAVDAMSQVFVKARNDWSLLSCRLLTWSWLPSLGPSSHTC